MYQYKSCILRSIYLLNNFILFFIKKKNTIIIRFETKKTIVFISYFMKNLPIKKKKPIKKKNLR